ncbi:hypothetical protein FIBSPDRAFT_884763 [Athelia psychrophila]|uniref:Uncharacterized protein n=1 Tax=Athelia psychrophila TaxID=1759441 RepID=A0A166SRF1_9AGAM|nr:hypothetical protein FIBSPDRAFT_884763 [Fibularhizoctonia sp. CBS 109695]
MPEERTVSNFPKINSADRSSQQASTIVNITKVKAHPIVRFCALSKYLDDGAKTDMAATKGPAQPLTSELQNSSEHAITFSTTNDESDIDGIDQEDKVDEEI